MKYKLGDAATITMGQSPSGKDLNTSNDGVPFLQGRKTFGRIYPTIDTWTTSPKKIAKGGSILLSLRAPVGDINIARGEICIGRGLCSIEPKENCLRDFLYYLLLFNNGAIRSKATGTTFEGINRDDLNNLEIDLPDLETQKKIVNILSTLDKKIELNNQSNKTLQELAESLFQQEFSDKKYGKKTIGDYLLPKRGKPLLSKDTQLGSIPVVAGGLEVATYHNQSNTSAPVITISASGANAGFVRLWGEKVWSSDSSFIDETITKNVYFWYVLLKTRQKEIYDAQTGSAQAHIYPKHIGDMPIGDIDDASIIKYNDEVKPIFERIAQNDSENKVLSSMRDTLLPKLLSGEINLDKVIP